MVDTMVKAPSAHSARWMPWIICGPDECTLSGMNSAAASEAAATPKLTAIC